MSAHTKDANGMLDDIEKYMLQHKKVFRSAHVCADIQTSDICARAKNKVKEFRKEYNDLKKEAKRIDTEDIEDIRQQYIMRYERRKQILSSRITQWMNNHERDVNDVYDIIINTNMLNKKRRPPKVCAPVYDSYERLYFGRKLANGHRIAVRENIEGYAMIHGWLYYSPDAGADIECFNEPLDYTEEIVESLNSESPSIEIVDNPGSSPIFSFEGKAKVSSFEEAMDVLSTMNDKDNPSFKHTSALVVRKTRNNMPISSFFSTPQKEETSNTNSMVMYNSAKISDVLCVVDDTEHEEHVHPSNHPTFDDADTENDPLQQSKDTYHNTLESASMPLTDVQKKGLYLHREHFHKDVQSSFPEIDVSTLIARKYYSRRKRLYGLKQAQYKLVCSSPPDEVDIKKKSDALRSFLLDMWKSKKHILGPEEFGMRSCSERTHYVHVSDGILG